MPASARTGGEPISLLFDLDGCLVDSYPSILFCWEQTLAQFGLGPIDPELMRHLSGPPVDEVARRMLPDADESTVAEVVAAYRVCSRADVDRVAAYPGVTELLAGLHERGIALAVATSKSIEVAEPVLEHNDLRRFFTAVEGTPLHEPGTLKAVVVQRVLRTLAPLVPVGLVGDREHDILGAHAHGIKGFGVLWGYGSRAELEAAGADALLAAPAEVAALV